jgi:hypothetical protein
MANLLTTAIKHSTVAASDNPREANEMLQLIIFLYLLPAAICTLLWLTTLFVGVVVWIFLAPFRLAGWLINAVKGALS